MKYLFCLWFIHTVQLAFSPFNILLIIRVFDRTRERSQDFHIMITIWFQIVLNLMIITNSCKSRWCYNHHLSFPLDFLLRYIAECFNNNRWFLLNIIRMQLFVFLNCLQCLWLRNIRIILYVLRNLIARSIRCIVLKNIQNESFFDCLTHRIYMEWMIRTIIPFCTEHLQCCALWCCCKRKEWKILMSSMSNHLTHQTVIVIQQFIFGFSFQFRILFQSIRYIRKCSLQFHCRGTSLWRMCFIHDNRKSLICCIIHFFINDWKFLQCCYNDSLSSVQCIL